MKITVPKNSVFHGIPVGSVVTVNDQGQYHSFNDEPAIRWFGNNHRWWCRNGLYHRESGPAIIKGTEKWWCQNGQIHRLDGPANTNYDSTSWWYHDTRFLYNDKIENNGTWVGRDVQKAIREVRPDLIDELVKTAEYLSLHTQEWICEHRPDLIGKISKVKPKVQAKYKHELELAGADL